MRRKRIFSIILCLAILLSLLPNVAFAAGTAVNVSTWDELEAVLRNPGDITINVISDIFVPQTVGEDALVVGGGGGTVTITGRRITLRRSGIVLAGDVTFKDIELYFTSPVRNAIIANGHTLTLENIANTSSSNISLFCGGITDYCGLNGAEIPAPGNMGHIIVKGDNTRGNLGNIYAGSLSDVVDGVPNSPNNYTGAAAVTLAPKASGTGDIYAHGARENRSGGFGNDMLPNADLYKATGGVTVNLSNNSTNVYGATGGSSNAAVVFTDAGNGYQYSPLLKDISSLVLNAGTRANMVLKAGSSFSPGAAVSVPENTILDFSNVAEASIGSLSGGGTLVLGDSQKLTIDGAVTGTTKVAVGGVNFDGTASTGAVKSGHAYLMATKAANGSFTLLPPSGRDFAFQRAADGSWIAREGAVTGPQVADFELGDASAASGAVEAELPVTATDAGGQNISDELLFMDGITVSVNGIDAPYDQNQDMYVSNTGLTLFFTYNEAEDGSCLSVGSNSPTMVIPDGTYTISVTIPGSSTVSGQSITAFASLTVEGKRITEDMVSLSKVAFTYDGNPQKPNVTVLDGTAALVEGRDYTVSYQRDRKATTDFTSAGTITVVVTGMGSYADTAVKSYTIQRATPGISLTAADTGDGKIALMTTLSKAGRGSLPRGTVQLVDITDRSNPKNIGSPINVKADGTASFTWTVTGKREYTIRAVYSGDTNYMANTVEKTISISKQPQAKLTITSKTTVSYGQTLTLTTSGGSTNKAVTYTVSPANGATVRRGVLTPSKVGKVTVTATMAGNDSYLDVTSAPVTISITKGRGVGSVTMADWTYGKKASEPVPVSATNGIDNVSYRYKTKGAGDASYTVNKPVKAGNYTVKATFAATANYTEAVATADFTIHDSGNSGGGNTDSDNSKAITGVYIPENDSITIRAGAVIHTSSNDLTYECTVIDYDYQSWGTSPYPEVKTTKDKYDNWMNFVPTHPGMYGFCWRAYENGKIVSEAGATQYFAGNTVSDVGIYVPDRNAETLDFGMVFNAPDKQNVQITWFLYKPDEGVYEAILSDGLVKDKGEWQKWTKKPGRYWIMCRVTAVNNPASSLCWGVEVRDGVVIDP